MSEKHLIEAIARNYREMPALQNLSGFQVADAPLARQSGAASGKPALWRRRVERARGSQPLTAQFLRDFLRNVARPFNVFRFKRDRGDSRMSTATVFFRECRQIVLRGIRIPRIRTDGNF